MNPAEARELVGAARALLPEATELRRRIHRWPEIGLELPRTQAAVIEALEGLPLSIETGIATSSVVATLAGVGPGPAVLLRADMDALPLAERTGLDFASERDGLMHACGHDAHVAMLVAAAHFLSARREELSGEIRFVFQPGEEGYHGARVMIEEGLLDRPADVAAAFSLHVATSLPSGWLASRPGVMLASTDDFTVTLVGRHGPAAAPHVARDPIPAACELVLALQAMVTRTVDVFDPAVLSVCGIHGGTGADNAIAERVEIRGTARSLSEKNRAAVVSGIRRMAESIAAAHELDVTVEIRVGYPVTCNDPALTEWALDLARSIVPAERVYSMTTPSMSGEDFAYVLQRVPGAVLVVGAAPPGVEHPAPLHSGEMVLDEAAMAGGIALHCALALGCLRGDAPVRHEPGEPVALPAT